MEGWKRENPKNQQNKENMKERSKEKTIKQN